MNKSEFLTAIKHNLRRYDKTEVEDVVNYYDELICDMLDGGMTETEAVASFGEMQQVLERISGEMLQKSKKTDAFTISMIIAGTLLSPVLLPVAICAITLYLVFYILDFSFVVGFGAGGIGALIYGVVMFFTTLFNGGFAVALTYLGLGLTVGVLFIFLAIFFFKGGLWLLRKINKMVIGMIAKRRNKVEDKK